MASAHLRVSSVSAERGGGWGHLQGPVCMAAAGFTCKKPMVGTGWPNSHPFRGFSSGREGFLGSLAGVCQLGVLTVAGLLMSGRG